MEKYLKNIKKFKQIKGFSNYYMGTELDITPQAYDKIEKGQTKLTVDRLFKIAEILDISILEIFEIEPKEEYCQTNKDTATGYLQKIVNFYQENKDQNQKIIQLYEERLKEKDIIIELLKNKTKI
jgi:transcriptional regulator with XRE-family HTH domain